MIKVRIKKLPTARTGYQVQGALVNDVPAMGGADYNAYIGQPKLKESKYITAVPREEANLEAEGGETVYGDINGDGFPEHQIIKGPRHHSGGVPLNLPDDTFIFSDTRGMKIKDPEILEMFGKAGTNKAYTPADLAKQYDIQKYRKILEDPNSDKLDRTTAELMIKKFVVKLGCLALAQEAKKGFPQGIPAVAKPCMEAKGITEQDILPKPDITALTEQIKKKVESNQNVDETMQSESADQQLGEEEQYDEAQQLNQGQPVAQPQEQQMQQPSPEEMMMYGGGMRRLRRAEQGMEQEMMRQPQQEEGGDDMSAVVQEIASALQQGTDPKEIVAALLQNQLPPETIVQIFMQLGASQEEAVQLIQESIQELQGGGQEEMRQQPMSEEEAMMMQQQQQAPPMAEYGMSMGGYDMPFYDQYEEEEDEDDQAFIPEAEYGMSMGAGMSQNYQGRPKPIPGSGPMFPIPKAKDGIIIKRSDFPAGPDGDKLYERKAYETSKDKANTGTKIFVIDASGKKSELTGFSKRAATETGTYDLNTWGPASRPEERKRAAAQYYLIEQGTKDPKIKAELIRQTQAAIDDCKSYVTKSKANNYKASTGNKLMDQDCAQLKLQGIKTWSDRGYTAADGEEMIKSYLNLQRRNIKMNQGYGISSKLFTDSGNGLKSASELVSKGVTNPKTQAPFKNVAEATAWRNEFATEHGVSNANNLSTAIVSARIGEPQVGDRESILEQATFHGYARMATDYQTRMDDPAFDPDLKYSLRNYIPDITKTSVGNPDESTMETLYPGYGSLITPLDASEGDTHSGMESAAYNQGMDLKDITLTPDPQCQCTDPNNTVTYGMTFNKATNRCEGACSDPDPCPCNINGVDTDLKRLPDGSCPPCETEEDVDIPGPPAAWWLQDTIKTTGAFGDLMGVKKYMPWAPGVELQQPRPTFLDPTRELAANAEQANIQTQGMAQFAGPQALSARSSSVQGQASKNAADILSKYNNANVNIANQFEMKGTDIANQESMMKQASAQKLYDQNTIANQQFDNSKLAMRNNLRNYYTNAITNRWQTDALNQMYPNYAVDADVGGRMDYRPGNRKFTGQGSGGSGFDWQKAKNKCTQANPNGDSRLITQCIESEKTAAMGAGNTTGANSQIGMGMYGNQQPRRKKQGGDTNGGGYIYMNPFIL